MKFVVCFLLLTLIVAKAHEGQVNTTTAPRPVSGHHDDDLNSLVQALDALQKKFDSVGLGSVITSYLLQQVNALKTEGQTLKTEVQALKTEVQTLKSGQQDRLEAFIESTVARQIAAKSQWSSADGQAGSTFIDWGRNSCPYNSTLVYTGVVGGKHSSHKGSGTNTLCLTSTPQFDNTPKPTYYGALYGTEYEFINNLHDHEVPCSVCLAPQPTTIMVPGTLTCPRGWTLQYNGHLASMWVEHYATEFVCLDNEPESSTGAYRDDNQHLINFVLAGCGSLPCPPYVDNKVVTCVVCSK